LNIDGNTNKIIYGCLHCDICSVIGFAVLGFVLQ